MNYLKKIKIFIFKLLRSRTSITMLLTLIVCATYGNVINGPFIFDDEHFIQKNKPVITFNSRHSNDTFPEHLTKKIWEPIKEIYTTSVTKGAGLDGNFYRPNQQFLFAILHGIFGQNPIPFHVANLIIHILNAILVVILLERLFFGRAAATLAGILFAIHPIQTESVAYISGLAEPLGLSFLLMGLLLMIRTLKAVHSTRRFSVKVMGIVGLFVLAITTKENMVICLPLTLILLMYLYTQHTLARKKTYANNKAGHTKTFPIRLDLNQLSLFLGIIATLCLGYIILKLTFFNFSGAGGLTSEVTVYSKNLHIRLITFITIIPEYLNLILWPKALFYEKPYAAYTTLNTMNGVIGSLVVLVSGAILLNFKRLPKLSLAIAWIGASMIPYMGIIPLNAIFLEHWLYVPMIGVGMLVSCAYEQINRKYAKLIFFNFFIPVCLVLMVRTIDRNTQWADIEKFYLNELKYSKGSARIFNNLGMYYADQNDIKKAETYYLKAATLKPYPQPFHNLANLYIRNGDLSNAKRNLIKALEINPNFYYSLGLLRDILDYENQPQKSEALNKLYQRVLQDKPNSMRQIEAALSVE